MAIVDCFHYKIQGIPLKVSFPIMNYFNTLHDEEADKIPYGPDVDVFNKS